MGVINKIFGSSESNSKGNNFWRNLESEHDLENAIEESKTKKVVIFKHSTRCFISKSVLKNFEAEVKNTQPDAAFYYLDLLAHRDISNKIAETFGIQHQSPQMIVVQNGKATRDASHENIEVNLI